MSMWRVERQKMNKERPGGYTQCHRVCLTCEREEARDLKRQEEEPLPGQYGIEATSWNAKLELYAARCVLGEKQPRKRRMGMRNCRSEVRKNTARPRQSQGFLSHCCLVRQTQYRLSHTALRCLPHFSSGICSNVPSPKKLSLRTGPEIVSKSCAQP